MVRMRWEFGARVVGFWTWVVVVAREGKAAGVVLFVVGFWKIARSAGIGGSTKRNTGEV